MDSLMSQLTSDPNLVLLRLGQDSVLRFEKICRTCFSTNDIKHIFEVSHENMSIGDLLELHTSVQVRDNDIFPMHMCNDCITELINCYSFKKKCLQTQVTLQEIIKYSESRKADVPISPNLIQVPFVIQQFLDSVIVSNGSTSKKTNKSSDKKSSVGEKNLHAQKMEISQKVGKQNNIELPEVQIKIEEKDDQEPACSKDKACVITSVNEIDEASVNSEDKVCLFDEGDDYVYDDLRHKKFGRNVATLKKQMLLKKQAVTKQLKQPVIENRRLCHVCGENFGTIKELAQHFRTTKHLERPKLIKCRICGKVLRRGHLRSHLRIHTLEKPHMCHICSKSFRLSANLKRHILVHTGETPYICEICGKGFTRVGNLNDHKNTHSGDCPYMCSYCGERFNHSLKHSLHLRKHGEGKFLRKEYKCNICSRVLSSKSSLKTHELFHGEKKFACFCGKKFHTKGGLKVHSKGHLGITRIPAKNVESDSS